jgi:hypothetical protein
MDPMTGEDTKLRDSGPAGTGGMRIVMVNARTAVLVPADEPDPIAAADVPGGMDDAGATAEDDMSHGGYDADDGVEEDRDLVADLPGPCAEGSDASPETADDGVAPDAASDLPMTVDEAAPSPSETPAADGPTGSSADESAHRGEGNPHWRDQLLSRLDDLGRLLSRALPTPDEGMAPLAAALQRLEDRVASAISRIEGRLDRLEQSNGGGTGHPDGSAAETDEAISDLRMQLRMVEVQVGALGRLLVTGSPDDGTGSDAVRTRLAELVAREQQLATGS